MSDELTWQPGPQSPQFAEDEVHVWSVSLAVSNETKAALLDLLSEDEQDRAARFLTGRLRRRFIVAHARQRIILSRYLNSTPSSIRFRFEPLGKPMLDEPFADRRIRFNLSHSGEMALLAVTLDLEVGVDLEQVREMANLNEFSRRYFAKQECETLAGLPPAQRRLAFFHCWTRKESILKATGKGLSSPLDKFAVSLDPDKPARVHAMADDQQAATDWWLAELNPRAGYVGAVAAKAKNLRPICWRFTDCMPQ